MPKLQTRSGIQPIVIGGFTFTDTGVEVKGRPDFDNYEGALGFAKHAHRCSGWWLSDLLRYGETRAEWAEHLSQVQDATGLSEKTLRNVRAIGAIPVARRRDDVEFHLHAEVAGMAPKAQAYWLRRAAEDGWDRRELRLQIRSARRARIIEGQAVLSGMYRVILADPPWLYGDRQPSESSSEAHYPGMTIEALCALPVQAHALRDSVLFMWTTAPMLYEHPGPREVGEAWGFTAKQSLIWHKPRGAGGYYTGGNHEILTIWTRGSCLPDEPTDLGDSVVTIRKGEHSEKPPEFRQWIEKHWTRGPRLEIFGRERVDGWTVVGNQADLWGSQSEAAS